MRLSFRDRLAENAERRGKCLHGTDFLENLIFCGGRAVIVKGKFDIAGREENKLIFNTIRPYNEIIKTLPKICDRLTFPVVVLWKVRLMEKAVDKEQFYIIGHIKVVYENGRPKGTLVLAPEVFTRPILTENQFKAHYAKLRNQCYKWSLLGEIRKPAPAIAKRITCAGVKRPGKKQYRLPTKRKKLSSGVARRGRETQLKKCKFVQPDLCSQDTAISYGNQARSNPAAVPEPLQQNERCAPCTLPDNKSGNRLDQSISKTAELSFTDVKPEIELQETLTQGKFQLLLKEWIEDYTAESDRTESINDLNSPLEQLSSGIARCGRETQIKKYKFVQPDLCSRDTQISYGKQARSNPAEVTESLQHNESRIPCSLSEGKTGRLLDQSIRKAAKLSFTGVGPEKEVQKTPTPGELQLLKEWIEDYNAESNTAASINDFNSPLGLMWLREFGTTKKKIEYAAGCKCKLANGVIKVNSGTENLKIRYSGLLERIVLYHKNKKGYRINTDREPVEGYHIQHIQSLPKLSTDEMHKLRKPQTKECNTFQNYKGGPTIKEFLDYILQHKELAEKLNTREKRKQKNVNNVLKDKNVKHEVKQRKRKRLCNKIKHEKARDVLKLLKQLKEETEED